MPGPPSTFEYSRLPKREPVFKLANHNRRRVPSQPADIANRKVILVANCSLKRLARCGDRIHIAVLDEPREIVHVDSPVFDVVSECQECRHRLSQE